MEYIIEWLAILWVVVTETVDLPTGYMILLDQVVTLIISLHIRKYFFPCCLCLIVAPGLLLQYEDICGLQSSTCCVLCQCLSLLSNMLLLTESLFSLF